jgi:hypothetical protein
MQKLNLPQHPLKIKEENGTRYIFDVIRKKYLVLLPEEWVRQNFVQFLVCDKNYAASLIAIEKGLKLNELQKRADIVIYDNQGAPIVLIECKAPKIKINQEVFEQVARYNVVFKVPYLVVTNGLEHYCAKVDFETSSFEFLEDIPDYKSL